MPFFGILLHRELTLCQVSFNAYFPTLASSSTIWNFFPTFYLFVVEMDGTIHFKHGKPTILDSGGVTKYHFKYNLNHDIVKVFSVKLLGELFSSIGDLPSRISLIISDFTIKESLEHIVSFEWFSSYKPGNNDAEKHKAGYTATQVAGGWAGAALLKKAYYVFEQGNL